MARDKRIALLMTWHRRVGLFMVVVLIVVIATGFLMNHGEQLKLAEVKLTSPSLLHWYGLERDRKLTGFHLESGSWLAESGGKLFLDGQAVAGCPASLKSALDFTQLHLALCHDTLMLITRDGTLLEAITPALGLPHESNRLGLLENALVIETAQGLVHFDIDALSASPVEPAEITWSSSQPLPGKLALKLDPTSISAEKLVQDIHSGRIFGTVGIILVDLSALLLLVLTITGLWSWLRHEKLHRPKK